MPPRPRRARRRRTRQRPPATPPRARTRRSRGPTKATTEPSRTTFGAPKPRRGPVARRPCHQGRHEVGQRGQGVHRRRGGRVGEDLVAAQVDRAPGGHGGVDRVEEHQAEADEHDRRHGTPRSLGSAASVPWSRRRNGAKTRPRGTGRAPRTRPRSAGRAGRSRPAWPAAPRPSRRRGTTASSAARRSARRPRPACSRRRRSRRAPARKRPSRPRAPAGHRRRTGRQADQEDAGRHEHQRRPHGERAVPVPGEHLGAHRPGAREEHEQQHQPGQRAARRGRRAT